MSYASALAKTAQAIGINPGSTSYFSEPSSTLDPRLFDDAGVMRSKVKDDILQLLFNHLSSKYNNPHAWTKAWIAGSGVSYLWEAAREPGDLDCLVGIEYVSFRQNNPDYAGLSNEEIAATFNEGFNENLMPKTSLFMGAYELTYYVNPQTNILDIKPYAAYDLINNKWEVAPSRDSKPLRNPEWDQYAQRDYSTAVTLVDRYSQALNEVRNAANPAHRVSAESRLSHVVGQAADLYNDIHAGRKNAFSLTGQGYEDWYNYRWQAGKRSGVVQSLRKLKDYQDEAIKADSLNTYGLELPSSETLIRRTAARKAIN